MSSYAFFANVSTTTTLTDTWVDKADSSLAATNKIYTITTPGELAKIAEIVNGGDNLYDYTINLDNDINLSGPKWVPIGLDNSHGFNGTFNGNGFTIKNMTIDSSYKYAGLFGCVGSSAIIQNVIITDATVKSTQYAGAAAGYSAYYYYSSATFFNINVINSKIEAYSTENNAMVYSGGIVGYKKGGKISKCFNLGGGNSNISAIVASSSDASSSDALDLRMGGIIGCGESVTIQYCSNNSSVGVTTNVTEQKANYNYAGGIAGYIYSSSTIDQCYNTGSITSSSKGNSYSGGICGYQQGGTITNCYNTGEVKVSAAGCDSPNWYDLKEFEGKYYVIDGYKLDNNKLEKTEECYVYKSNYCKNNDDLGEYLKFSYPDYSNNYFSFSPYIYSKDPGKYTYTLSTSTIGNASLYEHNFALDNEDSYYNKNYYMYSGEVIIFKCAANIQGYNSNNIQTQIEIKNYKGYTGGIVAAVSGGEIKNCYNAGKIDSNNCNSSRTYNLAYCLAHDLVINYAYHNKLSSIADRSNAYNLQLAGVEITLTFDVGVNSGNIYGAKYAKCSIDNNYSLSEQDIKLNLNWTQSLYWNIDIDAVIFNRSLFVEKENMDDVVLYGYNAGTYAKNIWKDPGTWTNSKILARRSDENYEPRSYSKTSWKYTGYQDDLSKKGFDSFADYYGYYGYIYKAKAYKEVELEEVLKHLRSAYETYFSIDPSKISRITLNAQIVECRENGSIGNKYCYEKIDTGIDTEMYEINKAGDLVRKEDVCTISSLISALNLGSNYWAVDTTGTINGGNPYLKAFYW